MTGMAVYTNAFIYAMRSGYYWNCLILMMRYLILFLLAGICYTPLSAQYNVRIELTSSAPVNSGDTLYLAGSFNGWNPADPKYKFLPGTLLVISLPAGGFEYKITRGSWDKAECKADGSSIPNRHLILGSDTVLRLKVEEWSDRVAPKPKQSTASRQVTVLDTAFYIPQLNRYRRVWIYLPENYTSDKKERYPVLYMHDGQNLFEDTTSYAGEWGVDECLDSMKLKKCIVVGIDHGGEKRMNEYSPFNHKQFGKGEGAAYVDFVTKKLKPFVDKKFRTIRNRQHTFIAGSSMGGLISMYAVLRYPKIFGGAGVFSPSFWVSDEINPYIQKRGKKYKGLVYFYAGKQEGEQMVQELLKAFEILSAVSKAKSTVVIRNDGMHNEATWRKEFALFYQWMNINR